MNEVFNEPIFRQQLVKQMEDTHKRIVTCRQRAERRRDFLRDLRVGLIAGLVAGIVYLIEFVTLK